MTDGRPAETGDSPNFRVLHFGNVAMNGYNNAKFLRRIDVAADVLCDEQDLLSQPEWEEAHVTAYGDPLRPPDEATTIEGWSRPPWVLPVFDPVARRRFRGQHRVEYALRAPVALPRLVKLHRRLRREFQPLRDCVGHDLELADVLAADRALWSHRSLVGDLPRLARRYDVIQAYGTHPALILVAAPDQATVAFEHGTMRAAPFENSWRGRMLALAYRRAKKVIITNADVTPAARTLGLDNVVFVPHPVDETKYTPGDSRLRAELESTGARLVLFAPCRHDWREKGNDRVLQAFASLVADGHDEALLVLGEWGVDLERSRKLAQELGLERRIHWLRPLPKLQLVDAYRAADIVLDQFVFGSFGTSAPEGMACGKPVVIHFDPGLHDWCFTEQPPLVQAREATQIAATLRRLADDADERARVGAAGRSWVERHHGWRLVAERQRAIYDEVTSPVSVRSVPRARAAD